jgi:DNA-binding XRE family transcriptional regulator
MPAGRTPVTQAQRDRARLLQQRLRQRISDTEMDLELLARTADVRRRTLDKYFAGDSPSPSFFLVVDLARALSMALDDLVGEETSHGQ